MMRGIVLLFLGISISQMYAQTGCVTYQRIVNRDSTLEKDLEGMPAVLMFNPQRSVFVYATTKLKESDFYAKKKFADSIGHLFFKDLQTKKVVSRELFLGGPYLYEESLPSISWRLSPETKKIGNFSCQKAVTHFRGRDYEAWFTADIPVRSGPWKFHGLPGLILEITSTNKEIQFLFVNIEMPATVQYQKWFPIEAPQKGKLVGAADYLEQYHSLSQKYLDQRNSELVAKGTLNQGSHSVLGRKKEPPIELNLE